MIRKGQLRWQSKYQASAWDLLVAKVFKDGVPFKTICVTELSKKLKMPRETIYRALRDGIKRFNPRPPHLLSILSAFDPPMAERFMCEPSNVWAKKRTRPPKTLAEIGDRIQQKEAEIAELHARYHEAEKARIQKKDS